MKKILIFLTCLLLTGCFEDSGKITKNCIKIDKFNSLEIKTEYVFTFKQDKINELSIIYDYNDSNQNTIKSVKQSKISEIKSLNIKNNVLNDLPNQYKIEFNMPLDNKNIYEKYNIKTSRTEMVKELKQLGYKCS